MAVHEWLVFVSHLPSKENASRMRVWRGLRASGAAILRDGVYLLPRNPACQVLLEGHAGTVLDAGGSAYVLRSTTEDDAQTEAFRQLFDRSEQYALWHQEVARLSASLVGLDEAGARRAETSVRRTLDDLSRMDFFPGDALASARKALTALTDSVNARFSAHEPTRTSGAVLRRDPVRFKGRQWATRKRLWIDRVASAWLIRRFIDPDARFVWLDSPGECPEQAVGFDFDHAEFTHVGDRVTFEVLLQAFGLTADAALARIGTLVHFLDVGGMPVGEAPGVLALLVGARQRCAGDDEFLESAALLFDDLHASFAGGGAISP